MQAPEPEPPPGPTVELFALIERSYRRATGRELADPAGTAGSAGPGSAGAPGSAAGLAERARWVHRDAPYGLLAHDGGADPRFVYANRTALARFEAEWSQLVGMPSRLSAPPGGQQDRNGLLARVDTHGWAEGYRGLRVSRTGRRFWIEDVVMWNLHDGSGARLGQAALFPRWTDADG